jgi:hypothetical protein
MTSINDKLGLTRPGRRRMMTNLPKTRAEAVKVTSAACPRCHTIGKAKISAVEPGSLYCTWCNHVWAVEG